MVRVKWPGETAWGECQRMIKMPRTIASLLLVAGVMALGACDIGQPMAVIPEPESQLTPKPGLLTDDNGEWVIYRKP